MKYMITHEDLVSWNRKSRQWEAHEPEFESPEGGWSLATTHVLPYFVDPGDDAGGGTLVCVWKKEN